MLILGIETSCDETAAAILEERSGSLNILSSVVSSQVKLHAKWGGVVPNLAAREHLKNILPVISQSFQEAKIKPVNLDLIAVTQGPGLIPALLVGGSAAKTLSYVWKKPLIGIHHIEGHIYANFIGNEIGVSSKFQIPNSKQIQNPNNRNIKTREGCKSRIGESDLKFPLLCLVVSGGHTQLVLMKKHLSYEIIGETLDDASGEAFDKVARILGLGYPGGPAIAEKAAIAADYRRQDTKRRGKFQRKSASSQCSSALRFPRPMISSNNFNFSFSGLKTAVLYETKKHPKLIKDKKYTAKICREFQQAVIDVLIYKTIKAAKKYKAKTVMLAGGVSANSELRNQMGEAVKKELPLAIYHLPHSSYSIDNAAMIAGASFFRQKFSPQKNLWKNNWKKLEPNASLALK